MASYLLYSAECFILAVKSLIFCVLMNVPSSKSIKRHYIHEESGYQDYIEQCNLFQPHWCLYNNVNTVKCFNWIYILASNEFVVICDWAFKLESRTVIINMKISIWVNYLCILQLIAGLINGKWDYKWGYYYWQCWSLLLLVFWQFWHCIYIYLLDLFICLPFFKLDYLFKL